ncbi:serine/threonine-protein kinase [Sandaracinus amylolyticus]|uniref:Serine/threonine protein kinase n=1 Tax=Sandaracinus amylolyticus TaxID=927083 RepID=A0A0F6YL96_9BACT|nr:serine/threonine-protein kinase [Sandaracinus amylolyticus]AKF09072.1 Serine/threonine protein kinase [Sandaracinus amylolyticus]
MYLRLDRLSDAVRSRRTRSLILLAASIPLWLFGLASFGMIAMWAVEPTPTPDWGAASFCATFGGAIPCLGAIALLFARHRYDRGTRALQALFTEAGSDGRVDRAALEARGWTRERADAVLLDALAHGLLRETASATPQPIGAQALAPVAGPPPFAWPQPPPSPSPVPASSPPYVSPVAPGAVMSPPPAPSPLYELADPVAMTRDARARAATASPASSALTGRVLKSTYLVEEPLGRGGMGAVFAARHLRTGRRYAVKTLLSTERFSREAILRFEREARAASAIGHSGIVGVHDFDRTDDGMHYLVMDLLSGETLETRLGRSGRLAWSDARRVAIELGDALAAAHRAGILHRDLKPANVFLAHVAGLGERAVLVDFGLAKPMEESAAQRVTSTGAVVGTALYMSPEQARGAPLDARSDVYGLAAVIYEMVTGVPPFLGPNALAVMTMVMAEQPVPPSMLARGLPAAVDHALLRALAKHPDQRPSDVASLVSMLAAIA